MITSSKRKIYWLLAFATISVLPFLLFAGYSIVQLAQAKEDDLQQLLIDRSQATANAVAERLAVNTGMLRALASTEAAQMGNQAALYAQAQRLAKGSPEISAIALITPDNMVQFNTLRPLGDKAFLAPDPDSVSAVFATGRPMVSEPYASPLDNKTTLVSVAVPVFRDGEVVYCLRAAFRVTLLNALLAAQRLPSDWTSGILSRSGLLVARSRAPEKFVGKPASAKVLGALAAQNKGVFDSLTIEGDANKAVIVAVPGWGWSVVVGVPSGAFAQPLRQASLFLSVFGLAALALGGAVVAWMGFAARAPSDGGSPFMGTTLRHLSSFWSSVIALVFAVSAGAMSTQLAQNAYDEIASLTDQRQTIYIQRRHLVELISAYSDIESGQRGFLITGEESFLAPYRAALPKVPLLTNAMQSELQRVGVTAMNWPQIADFSAQRLDSAAKGIALRNQLGLKAMQNKAFFANGQSLTDKLRLHLGNLDSQLDAEVARINGAIAARTQTARQIQWISQFAISALLLLSVLIWLIERRRRHAALDELQKANATLEERVASRTHALKDAGEKIKNFAAQAEATLEIERKRLSREVHDQIGQIFTGIKMIVRTLKPGSLPDEQQGALMGAIDSGVVVSRRIAAELRPPLLDDFGMLPALDHYLKTTFLPLDMAFDLEFPKASRLTAPQKNQLFRIIQEACTNVIRHAQASQVDVIGRFTQDGLEVCIEDDGVGFNKASVRADAMGLRGIEERANLCGAVFSIEPRAAGGTRMCVRFPAHALLPEGTP